MRFPRTHRRLVILVALVVALIAAGASMALATSGGKRRAGRPGRPGFLLRGWHGDGDRVRDAHIVNQMFVQYQIPKNVKHEYPLVLIHGGSGQGLDWMQTPDGRNGWADHFLAAGYKVYIVDRPAYGRSANNLAYDPLGSSPMAEQFERGFTAMEKQDPLAYHQAPLHKTINAKGSCQSAHACAGTTMPAWLADGLAPTDGQWVPRAPSA